jgi:hypothetical protein
LGEDFPPFQAHPALNPVVQVLDCKKHGRAPKNCHILDIPAQYSFVRKDGSIKWEAEGCLLTEPEDLKLQRKFEWRCPEAPSFLVTLSLLILWKENAEYEAWVA